jgi:predicted dehydrogenase
MRKLNVGHIGWLSRDEGPDCRTVAWCDVQADKLKALADRHPDIAMYTDYREMVKHPGLDLVCISTPNWLHTEMACAFLEAGVHVFLEKPMSVTRAEMDRLLVTQRRSGKQLSIDFEMRVAPSTGRIKAILDSGEIGELRRLELIHHRGGWLEEGNGIWRTRTAQSGGLFLMEPIHTVDIFRYYAGEVVAVQSTSGPNVLKNYKDFPDNVVTHLFFENGVLGTILTTHTLSAVTRDPQKWPDLGHDMTMIFTCTRGTLLVDFLEVRILVNRYEDYPPAEQGTRVVFDRCEDYSAADDYHSFFHDITRMRRTFISRCAEDKTPVQDALDAWKTHLVCLAAEESAKTDFRRIALDYTLPKELGRS